MSPPRATRLVVMIPCLDEAATLPATLAELPRSVPGNASTGCQAARVTGATTSCAMRMPRSTAKGPGPRLISATFTSPR